MSEIYVTFMLEKQEWKYVNDVFICIQQMLLQKVILGRLKKRFLSMSKPKKIEYERENDSQMYTNYVVWVECEGCETIKVLETFLVEIAQLRVHGIKENELSEGLQLLLSISENTYLNRHYHSSEELQNNYIRHFIYSEPELSPKLQAQLMIALTKSVNMEQMTSFCELQLEASNLSVIILQSKNFVTQEDMKRSLQTITDLEKEGSLVRWSDEEVEGSNNLILKMETESGKIFERVEHSDIGAVELILSNGMQVTYQCTKDDSQVLLSGFSYGGLSELTEADLLSCSFSSLISQNVWSVTYERLHIACDTVTFRVVVDEYKRAFSASFDSLDIELALQIVYLLFTSDFEPKEEDLQAVTDDIKERLSPTHQQLQDILLNTAKEINSGRSCFYKPPRVEDLSQVNTSKAWQYFKNCFRDPSSFQIIVIGKFDSASVDSLLSRYLGGIPRPSISMMNFQRGKLTPAPFHFPPAVITEEVPMAMDRCNGMYICMSFPLHLKNETLEDRFLLDFLRPILRIKVLDILRHRKGMVYSIEVSNFNPNGDWSSSGTNPGMLYFTFHLRDRDAAKTAVDAVVHAIEELQGEGPSEHLVQCALDSVPSEKEEERNMPLSVFMTQIYWSNHYDGDLPGTYKFHIELKRGIPNRMNAEFIKSLLKRLLPYPCGNQYTVIKLTC